MIRVKIGKKSNKTNFSSVNTGWITHVILPDFKSISDLFSLLGLKIKKIFFNQEFCIAFN